MTSFLSKNPLWLRLLVMQAISLLLIPFLLTRLDLSSCAPKILAAGRRSRARDAPHLPSRTDAGAEKKPADI